MDHEAHTTSGITLLEMRDRLIEQLRHDAPAGWPAAIGHFLNEIKAVQQGHGGGRIEPGSLVPEVQAQRVATYIDEHFAEPITLRSLGVVSGCCTRQLSRAFRSTMQMSIRQYVQKTRIDHAAARLREGDKVESVVAAVGWRGRKNFFHQFKSRVGATPAQYRECWLLSRGRKHSAATRPNETPSEVSSLELQ